MENVKTGKRGKFVGILNVLNALANERGTGAFVLVGGGDSK